MLKSRAYSSFSVLGSHAIGNTQTSEVIGTATVWTVMNMQVTMNIYFHLNDPLLRSLEGGAECFCSERIVVKRLVNVYQRSTDLE